MLFHLFHSFFLFWLLFLLGTLSALKATTIAIVLILLHGFCDSFATSETIRKVLYEKMDSAKCKMILGYCNLFGILICTTLVDKIGRKVFEMNI